MGSGMDKDNVLTVETEGERERHRQDTGIPSPWLCVCVWRVRVRVPVGTDHDHVYKVCESGGQRAVDFSGCVGLLSGFWAGITLSPGGSRSVSM